jgi:hypothetical protein
LGMVPELATWRRESLERDTVGEFTTPPSAGTSLPSGGPSLADHVPDLVLGFAWNTLGRYTLVGPSDLPPYACGPS